MDHSLRQRVRQGDPAAFGELFDREAQAVYRHALRLSGNPQVAEEVVSVTFLEAWQGRHRLRPEGDSLLPWLLGIATNVHRNVARAARRHREALARLPPRQVVTDFADETVDRMGDAEKLHAVRAALARLRRADREVFTLCVWAGLSHAAAAEALGVPEGTVRSRLSRARTRLTKLTDEELKKTRAKPERPLPGGQHLVSRLQTARSTQETIR
ncbi:sigma-70 family RNA polymerase sigma factor [Microbispora amethystogenes]|uniref:DNA-directed RNA polymerase sigma-70 factor n=1 Tax=Microbispora amethystogenes TaxID=1427754 RepID=A0ABQ4FDQ8_9ACTN|nr:DNA-directed RNA polymerase sigma-70 factor [Microbispora amethystogenes]